jgi:chromosome segregation ATPase
MNKELAIRIARRAVVLGATIAVLSVGVVTVQAAAQWRAASAPIDAAPAAMTTIGGDLATESERAAALAGQVDDVAQQLTTLKAALTAANEAMAGDAESAAALQADMDGAISKLVKLQGQLKGAQARLTALNKAAARQAALNRAAAAARPVSRTTTVAAAPASGGEPDDD